MTHKRKDCLDRPRETGAKWTGSDIKSDEVITTLKQGYDAKRDRWNGYDAAEYQQQIEAWERVDAKRKELREAELARKLEAKYVFLFMMLRC